MVELRVGERIARGVAFLDAKVPDWRGRIDTRYLSIERSTCCILTQVHGSYQAAVRDYFRGNFHEAIEHGFGLLTRSTKSPLFSHSLAINVTEAEALNAAWTRILHPPEDLV